MQSREDFPLSGYAVVVLVQKKGYGKYLASFCDGIFRENFVCLGFVYKKEIDLATLEKTRETLLGCWFLEKCDYSRYHFSRRNAFRDVYIILYVSNSRSCIFLRKVFINCRFSYSRNVDLF